jgi:hypothetical protein
MGLVLLLHSASCIICTSLIALTRARAHTHTHTHVAFVWKSVRSKYVIPSVLCFYTQHNKTQGAGTTRRPIWKCLAIPLTVSSRLQAHIFGLLYFPSLDILLYLQLAPSHLNLILLNTWYSFHTSISFHAQNSLPLQIVSVRCPVGCYSHMIG